MVESKKGLVGFFDNLVPAGLRERRRDDYVEYVHIRALSAIYCGCRCNPGGFQNARV